MDILSTIILYILSVLTFLFLFKYLIDFSSYDNAIYVLLGAKKRTIFMVILSEIVLLTLVSSIVAALLHITVYPPLLSQFNILEGNLRYYWWDYLLMLGVTTVLSLIASLPFILSTMLRSPAALRRKYEV